MNLIGIKTNFQQYFFKRTYILFVDYPNENSIYFVY